MQVVKVKTLVVSFLAAMSLNYFAAFSLVGWNFLVPGQYTFGIVSISLLVALSVATLMWVATRDRADAQLAAAGVALAVLAASMLIQSGMLQMKDYFILGFFFSVPVAVLITFSVLWSPDMAVHSVSVRRGFSRAVSIWAVLLGAYLIGVLADVASDVQRFQREQVLVLGPTIVVSALLVTIIRHEARRRVRVPHVTDPR